MYPYFTPTLPYILSTTVLLGMCCGIAFGSSYQLVSHFDTRCSKALTIGLPISIFLQSVDKNPYLTSALF